MQENPGLGVGAPPSVRKGVEPEHLRTRLGCSYGSRRTRFWCRRIPIWMWEHRPRCERESSQSTFAPGAGAPTVREEPGFGVGESRFGCGSTAPGAKGSRARTPLHPARVLLRFEKNPGFDVGESRFGCRSTALGAKGSRARAPS